MGDGVAMGADGGEVGAVFGWSEREFPETFTPGVITRGEEDFVVLNPEKGVFFDWDEFFAGFFDGEVFGGVGLAEVFDGADEAGGISWGAKGLAKLHEGGIEETGWFVVEEFAGSGPDDFLACGGIDRLVFIKEAGEDAGDIAIDDGCGLVKGEAADGPSGVSTDSRKA